jgi:HlyD family secretion protein
MEIIGMSETFSSPESTNSPNPPQLNNNTDAEGRYLTTSTVDSEATILEEDSRPNIYTEEVVLTEEPLAKPKRKFNPRLLLLIGAVLAAGYFGWQYFAPKPVATFIAVSGRIEADETDIAAKTGGRVATMLVREGEQVSAGQAVAKIEDLEVNEQLKGAVAQVNSVKQEAAQAQLEVAVADSRIQEAAANLQQSKGDSRGRVDQASSTVAVAKAQLSQAQAQVGEAQAQIKQANAEWQLARKNRDRYSQLVKDGAVNRQQFDQAETTAATAQAKLESAQAGLAVRFAAVKTAGDQFTAAQGGLTQNQSTQMNPVIRNSQLAAYQQQKQQAYAKLAAAQAKVQNAVASQQQVQKRLDSFQVNSPLTGVVQSRAVEPGAVVATGKTLLTVIDPKAVYLRAYVPEGDLSKIHVGQTARILLDTDTKQSLTAKVSSIDPKASFTPENIYFKKDRVRQVFGIKLSINQDRDYAKPGMPAEAEIDLK